MYVIVVVGTIAAAAMRREHKQNCMPHVHLIPRERKREQSLTYSHNTHSDTLTAVMHTGALSHHTHTLSLFLCLLFCSWCCSAELCLALPPTELFFTPFFLPFACFSRMCVCVCLLVVAICLLAVASVSQCCKPK